MARHRPVLLEETVGLLRIRPGGTYVDGTFGGGGHARAILARCRPGGRVVGIDCDAEAIRAATREGLDREPGLRLIGGDFADMDRLLAGLGVREVDGILLDLGMSSDQLADPERGFAFQRDGPLDMRLDRSRQRPTAADLVNTLSVRRLREILAEYGEERAAGRIAAAIAVEREQAPVTTTGRLREIVERVAGGRRGRIHPATRTFQALRVAVNDELETLARGLRRGLDLLVPGGRLAVISFHSLEDRIVKSFFRDHEGREEHLAGGGSRWAGELPRVRRVTRRAVAPSSGERAANPRARSAKLRVAERTAAS